MVTPEQLQAYNKSVQDEKDAAEESAKTGKPVIEILAAKEKAAAEKAAKEQAAAAAAEKKQEQEEAKQATIAEQKQK